MNSETIDIYLTDYLSNKKRLHYDLNNCPSCDDIHINNIATFNYTHTINQKCLIQDNDNRFSYYYTVPKIGDMISDIDFSINGINYSMKDAVENKISKIKIIYYSIGGILHYPDEMTNFLFICARFCEFKIIVSFEELPNLNDKIELNFIYYRMNKQDIELLTDYNTRILSGHYMYENDKFYKLIN